MMILTNRPMEQGQTPQLYPSSVSAVEIEEEKGSSVVPREDSVSISPEAAAKVLESPTAKDADEKSDEKSNSEKKGTDGEPLSEEEKKAVEELKSRDREVRAHEQAHIAAGGVHIRGGASYDYQSGPDGAQYAVGGNVDIDTSPVSGDPDATIRKMQTVRAAAMAPADPSGQDHSVASSASATMAKAMAEKAKAMAEKTEEPEEPETKKSETESSKDVANESTANPSTQSLKTNASISAYTQNLATSGSRINMVG